MSQNRTRYREPVSTAEDLGGAGESFDLLGHGTASLSDQYLLVREVAHRCANDLQLVVGLLQLQARRAHSDETRDALEDAANRVAILAEARTLGRERQPTLESALKRVCVALNSQAEPRSILVALEVAAPTAGLSEEQVTNIALCVNELATNAIKHAFDGQDGGTVTVTVRRDERSDLVVCVEDDGHPVSAGSPAERSGLGLDLVRRLLGAVGARLSVPGGGSKRFEIRMAQNAW